MLTGILNFIGEHAFDLIFGLASLLPMIDMIPDFQSLFADSGIVNYLGYLNWVFPVATATKFLLAWATACVLYMVYLTFSDSANKKADSVSFNPTKKE